MIRVPAEFAEATTAREGEAGTHWIALLPSVVEDLCRQWALQVDGMPLHGYLSLVVPVRQGAEPAVLKIAWSPDATREEVVALRAWDGQGAVRVLAADLARGALLLERLDATQSLDTVAIEPALQIAGQLLRRLAIHPPNGVPRLSTVATGLAQQLPERWERYGRPMPQRVLHEACDLARDLGRSGADLLVNYDLHYPDVLAGTREPWLAVDPKVVVGDVEYGVAQLLWRRLEDIEAHGGLDRHFSVVTRAAALDPILTRAWTLVRCVDYWLWGLSVGLTYDPARCERIITWLAQQRCATPQKHG